LTAYSISSTPRSTAVGGQLSPCNVERLSEDRYQIRSRRGFSPDEIAITAEQSVLTVEGR